MPSREYRIIVSDKVVHRTYTNREHDYMVSAYDHLKISYTKKIVDLI